MSTGSRSRTDSGGAGTFRGGLGVVREYEILDGEVSLSHRGERHFFSAPVSTAGRRAPRPILSSGGPAAARRSSRRRRPRRCTRATSLVIETAGGGGYGDPRGRSAEHVREDVRNGKVGEDAARSVYGQARQP